MVRALIVCILSLVALATRGDAPKQIARLTGDAEEMRLHVRTSNAEFSVLFVNDTADSLLLRAKNVQKGDGTYSWLSTVYIDGNSSIPAKIDVAHESADFSLCVTQDAGGVRIDAGDGTRIFDGLASFNATKDTKISVYPTPKEADIVDFAVRYKPQREKCRFTSIDQLYDHVTASTDSLEDIWQWLDCQTDAPAVVSGGRYRIATVRNDNGYDIVYIDGATIGSWQALDVKGHLTPTDFVNHYDVTWCDSKGCDVGEGVYASLDADGILTVTFTPRRSELRFTRVKQ